MNPMTYPSRFVAALLLLLVTACSATAPSHHYLLRAAESLPASNSRIGVGVGPISIPEYLQRDNLVLSGSGSRLDIRSHERWAEPLDQGIGRVLALNLAGLLQTQDVQSYPWHPRRQPAYAVKLRVLELDAGEREARMVAEWLLLTPADDAAVERRLVQLTEPLQTGSADAVASAYSSILHRLSEEIAAAIEAEIARQASATGAI